MPGQLDDGRFPRLDLVHADEKHMNRALEESLAARGDPFKVRVEGRPEAEEGFVKLPKRWAVERGLAWLGRDRGHGKDYEWHPESSETWVKIGAIRGTPRRLAPSEKKKSRKFDDSHPKAAWLPGQPPSDEKGET